MFSELQRQTEALTQGNTELQAAATALQAALEKNQSLSLIIEQQSKILVENQKLIAMMSNQILSQHYQFLQVDGQYADQRLVNDQLAGQLEDAHLRIAALQGGKA